MYSENVLKIHNQYRAIHDSLSLQTGEKAGYSFFYLPKFANICPRALQSPRFIDLTTSRIIHCLIRCYDEYSNKSYDAAINNTGKK